MFKTYYPKLNEIERKWVVIDADGKVLGRLASQVAAILRGKNKPTFTPHMDTGDFVVIVNAEKVRLTGHKSDIKTYFSHSGYMGGERFRQYKDVMATKPESIIERAVKGMLPHNVLGRQLFRKLKVYCGPEHPHTAQKPKFIEIEG